MATSIAVIGLNIAFVLPIILRIRAGSRFEQGAWSLGRHYRWISPLAVAWIVFICVVGILPVSPKASPAPTSSTGSSSTSRRSPWAPR